MSRGMTKFFCNIRSTFEFFQIMALAFNTIHILYWTQNLMEAHWRWLDFFKPVLDFVLYIAGSFSSGTVQIFTTIFEIKYVIAMCLYILCFYIMSFCIDMVNKLESVYGDVHQSIKKFNQDMLNTELEKSLLQEETKIQDYSIYVSAYLKKAIFDANIDLNEHLKNMNEFLTKNTLVKPKKYENGFLYSFNNFERIDHSLDVFFKLINSKSPLDYIICVQADQINNPELNLKMKNLIKLKFVNKISTSADTVFRYKCNQIHKYSVSQLGVYQNEDSTQEVYQFTEDKNL